MSTTTQTNGQPEIAEIFRATPSEFERILEPQWKHSSAFRTKDFPIFAFRNIDVELGQTIFQKANEGGYEPAMLSSFYVDINAASPNFTEEDRHKPRISYEQSPFLLLSSEHAPAEGWSRVINFGWERQPDSYRHYFPLFREAVAYFSSRCDVCDSSSIEASLTWLFKLECGSDKIPADTLDFVGPFQGADLKAVITKMRLDSRQPWHFHIGTARLSK